MKEGTSEIYISGKSSPRRWLLASENRERLVWAYALSSITPSLARDLLACLMISSCFSNATFFLATNAMSYPSKGAPRFLATSRITLLQRFLRGAVPSFFPAMGFRRPRCIVHSMGGPCPLPMPMPSHARWTTLLTISRASRRCARTTWGRRHVRPTLVSSVASTPRSCTPTYSTRSFPEAGRRASPSAPTSPVHSVSRAISLPCATGFAYVTFRRSLLENRGTLH